MQLTWKRYAVYTILWSSKIVSEYDHELPQSQTADKPIAPRGRATQQSRDTISLPYQDDCKTLGFTDIKKPDSLHHPVQTKDLHYNPEIYLNQLLIGHF